MSKNQHQPESISETNAPLGPSANAKTGGGQFLSALRPNRPSANTATPNILGHKFGSGPDRQALRTEASKKLTVGKEISLSGEISSCEHLVVEGEVRADVIDAQLIEITVEGMFNGKIVADIVNVQGTLKGDIHVTETLTVKPGGKVSGKITYKELIVEAGGVIEGTLRHSIEKNSDSKAAGKK